MTENKDMRELTEEELSRVNGRHKQRRGSRDPHHSFRQERERR